MHDTYTHLSNLQTSPKLCAKYFKLNRYYKFCRFIVNMAKLHSYYVLCPLIDRNSFLGVSQDKETEHVLVSLGRNVVNKYRISDQKQISGWTSRDHITSAIIYDKEQDAYVGVFNKNTIKLWKDDSDNLDKLKKHKFSVNILKIVPTYTESSLVIFENGNCAFLPYAIDNRKTYENRNFFKETDSIVDTSCYVSQNTNHICYIIKNNKNDYEIVMCPLREELGDMEKSKFNKEKVFREEDVFVVGKLISTQESPCVYFLWNDAKMTKFDLIYKTWKTVGTVPWISTTNCVSIAWMGENHLILFGNNCDQDGAIIVAYNVILGVGSCRYPMKMHSEGAQLYCFNNYILLEASNHIGMLPFILETNRNLSSLLGSHDIVEETCMEIAYWDTTVKTQFKVCKEIENLMKFGLTERNMCTQIILPLLDKGDFPNIFRLIKQFKDVPESVIVSLLNYTISLVNPDNVDVTNDKEFTNFINTNKKTKKKNVKSKFELLNYIFRIDFSDALLIPHLRVSLSLDNALFLLRYIPYLLCDSTTTLDSVYESKLIDWCTLLMDSFYQQYLLTKDEKVSYVLDNVQKVVGNLIEQLMVVDDTLPLLHKFISGEKIDEGEESLLYTIQLIEI